MVNTVDQNNQEQLKTHIRFMELALKEAEKALAEEEVPIGAILVYQNEVIGRGYNQRERQQNPIAHAEIKAITEAATALKRWRLTGTRLYVTLEPCAMCAGAMVLARIDEVVFATRDPKAGACGSLWNIATDLRLNHRLQVVEDICAETSRQLLRTFFQGQRQKAKYRPSV